MDAPSRYQPFYCEENVFHLCHEPRFDARSPCAVFITGTAGNFVMWHQKAARSPRAPVLWDYHVILLVQDPWEIWDLDTTLDLPMDPARYLDASFQPAIPRPAGFAPRFRVVPRGELAEHFASDRSHMRLRDGRFRKPPPPWPAIGAEGAASTLGRFLDLDDSIAGTVLDLDGLRAEIATPRGAGALDGDPWSGRT